MAGPETLFASRIREEFDLWSKAMKEHDVEAEAYFAEMNDQIKQIENQVLQIQTDITNQISALAVKKTKKEPASSIGKKEFESLQQFYANLDQASLEKNIVGSDRELREWVSECISAKQRLDRLTSSKKRMEGKKNADIETDIQLAKANREECQKRIKLGIMERKSKAFEDFWNRNEKQLDTMISATKKNPNIRPLLERLKELKNLYTSIKERYDEQRKIIVQEITDSYAAYNSFELELDKLAFPEKYKVVTISEEKSSEENWPNQATSDPATFSKKLVAQIAAKVDYSSLRNDDLQKCFKDPVQTPYQKLTGEFLSPATPNQGLFLIASVGAGKTFAGLSAIAKTIQWHIENPRSKRPRICVILLPNENLFYNWEKDMTFFGPTLLKSNNNWKFLSTSKVTTREWRLDLNQGEPYNVILHKYSTQLPEKFSRFWGGILPKEGLCIVDECQNLVQPMKLSVMTSAQEMALSFGKELSKHANLKRLIMTATPLLDETRISDLFKLLNIVKATNSPHRYKNEGLWRRGQTVIEESQVSASEKYKKSIHDETQKILSQYFDLENGKWLHGAREKFMIENLGIISNVRLEGDIGVYPTVNTMIPDCNENDACVLTLQQDLQDPSKFLLNPYAQGQRPLTKEELDAVQYKDYRHIRTIKIAVPLGPLATKAFLANLPKAKKFLKVDCKGTAFDCIDWTSKANPLSIGKGFSLKTRREGKKTEYASKAVAFSELLKRYPDAKHFGITPARIYGDGPKSILDYLGSNDGFKQLDLKSLHSFLSKKDKNPQNPWKKAVDAWYESNKEDHRVIYFGRMQGEDDPNQRSLFGELVQNIWNDPRNIVGKYVQAFVGDRYAAEGLNLFGVQYVHLFEPLAPAMKQQSLGRALRYCAAKLLDPSKRKITIFTYVAELPATISAKRSTKSLNVNLVTADQYLYDSNASAFDPVNEFYKALAEVSVDCVLMQDYNQLATCFPYEKKQITAPEFVELVNETPLITNSITCRDPLNGTIISNERMKEELDQFGYVFLEPNLEGQCRQLGYILDKGMKYDLKDEILVQLLQMSKIQPGEGQPFERYTIMRRAATSPALQEGVFTKVSNYVRGFWKYWTQKGESMPRETNHYVVDKNGNFILELQEIPLSLKEQETGKPYRYDRASYDLASRLLIQPLEPKLIVAMLNRINEKDASTIYQYLLTKRLLVEDLKDLKDLEKKARKWIVEEIPEQVRMLKLESLQKKTKKRPTFRPSESLTKKAKTSIKK